MPHPTHRSFREMEHFVQGEILSWFQVLLYSIEPCYTRTSGWSPPVIRNRSLFVQHACSVLNQGETPSWTVAERWDCMVVRIPSSFRRVLFHSSSGWMVSSSRLNSIQQRDCSSGPVCYPKVTEKVSKSLASFCITPENSAVGFHRCFRIQWANQLRLL